MPVRISIVAAIGLALVLGASCAKRVWVAPTVDTSAYRRLAILPFANENISYVSVTSQLADEITLLLLERAPEVEVVERTKISVLTLPENLQDGARSKEEVAIALGQLLEVDAVLTGTVITSVENIGSGTDWDRRVYNGVAIVRLVDVRDGRIVWARREETEHSSSRSLYGSAGWRTDSEVMREVVRDLAELIAQNFYSHYERRYR